MSAALCQDRRHETYTTIRAVGACGHSGGIGRRCCFPGVGSKLVGADRNYFRQPPFRQSRRHQYVELVQQPRVGMLRIGSMERLETAFRN